MGDIVEKFADDRGIVWPENVAPAKVSLVRIGTEPEVVAATDALYEKLQSSGVSVLYDDRDARPGEKFADADLMGIPHRIVVSSKLVEAGKCEYKNRSQQTVEILTRDELFAKIA